jgi:hypothetical protein
MIIYRVNVQCLRIACYAVPQTPLHSLTSLFRSTVGVRSGHLLVLYTTANSIFVFIYFLLHPMSYSIPSFLNVTVLHYNILQRLYTIKSGTGS